MSAASAPAALHEPILPSLSISNDALSVALSFLDCPSLNAALAVCKRWHAVILSMCSIGLRAGAINQSLPFTTLLSSPFARRHLGSLTLGHSLGAKEVVMLTASLMHLRELSFDVSLMNGPPGLVWSFPPSLRSLTFEGPYGPAAVSIRSAIIGAITQLSLLQSLTITQTRPSSWRAAEPVYELAPLAALPRLTALTVDFPAGSSLADGIRALPLLERLSVLHGTDEQLSEFCERLTQPPHSLRLQHLQTRRGWMDRITAAMARVPTITDLAGWFGSISGLHFLTAFPRLSSLAIESLDHERITPEMLADRLVALPRLTRLSVSEPMLCCADLSRVLRALPLLADLELDSPSQLESLRCFAEVAPTLLTRLALYQLEHPSLTTAEFEHLKSLNQLTHLCLDYAREGLIDEATKQALTPPSAMFPKLVSFQCGSDEAN